MEKFNFAGKKILVLGAARSGSAAARALKRAGADVLVSEAAIDRETQAAAVELGREGIEVELGQHRLELLGAVDLVVPSPGITPSTPILAAACNKDVPVFSEVEVAWHLTDNRIIGVTGTNGKTTTATLIGEIFNASGQKAVVSGNIGYPLTEAIGAAETDAYLVAELSSFQLEFTRSFRPDVAVLLNISIDHLDWHNDFDSYIVAKHKIFAQQRSSDLAVINRDDPAVWLERVRSRKVFFSRRHPVVGSYCHNGRIVLDFDGEQILGKPEEIRIKGEHNLENALAAAAVAAALEIDPAVIMNVLRTFPGVEHRLEPVREVQGVSFFNDSKATNPEAALKGIKAFNQPIILLAGGRNKGNSFATLAAAARGRVKAALLFGESADQMKADFGRNDIRTEIVKTLEDAVYQANSLAQNGDVVLFSPACASYDMFQNFEERGWVFKEAVMGLKETED